MRLTYLIPLFLVVLFFVPTNVFSQDDNSEPSLINYEISITHIILAILIAIISPLTYTRIQKYSRKKSLIKFWKILLSELNNLDNQNSNAFQITKKSVANILVKMEKIEFLIASVYSEEKFHEYLSSLEYHFDLVDIDLISAQQNAIGIREFLTRLTSD